MKDGICPKCGSGEVFKRKSVYHNRVDLGQFGFRYTIPMQYVCSSCGYFESYIEDRNFLNNIRDRWESANPHKRKN